MTGRGMSGMAGILCRLSTRSSGTSSIRMVVLMQPTIA